MKTQKFIHILVIFFCITHCIAEKFTITNKFEKEWKVKKDHVVNYDRSMGKNEGTFLYASCDPSSSNCTFVLDNLFSYWPNQRANMTCHLKLNDHGGFNNLSLERFLSDSIFISLPVKDESASYNEYGFLQMPNCEHTRFGKVEDVVDSPVEKSLSKFVLYRNSFDVIDYKNHSCEHNLCRLRHNYEDGRTSAEFAFAENLNPWSIQPVNYDNDQDGFFVLSNNETAPLIATIVTKSGEIHPLLTIPQTAVQYWYPRYANYRFAVCWTEETEKYFSLSGNLHCTQYAYVSGLDLRKVLDITVHTVKSENTTVLALHNIGSGGLLILTGRCDDDVGEKFACKDMMVLRTFEDQKKPKDSFKVPEVNFGCRPLKDSVSVDIKQTGENNLHFLFAAICEGSHHNTIKFKRVIISEDL